MEMAGCTLQTKYLLWMFIILFEYGASAMYGSTISGVETFCQHEPFEASCDNDEVIVIRSAFYGRMRMGRCVTNDFGYVGCNTNVTDAMTSACSGLRTCTISNLASLFTDLTSVSACPNDLTPYLEAEWYCVKVAVGSRSECEMGFMTAPGSEGYLASDTANSYGYGTQRCPWSIKAHPGQHINISLIDFSAPQSQVGTMEAQQAGHPRYCREYAELKETKLKNIRSIVFCDGDSVSKHVYVSLGHMIEVQLATTENDPSSQRFLLKYEVFGCPLPELRNDVRARQTGNELKVRCNKTSDSWTLTCVNGDWIGTIGNCTTVIEPVRSTGFLPLGITVLIIIGVAVLICIVTLVVGLIQLKGRRKREEHPHPQDALLYGTASRGNTMKMEPIEHPFTDIDSDAKMDPNKPRFATIDRQRPTSPARVRQPTGSGEYTQIWEVSRPSATHSPSGGKTGETHSDKCGTFPKNKGQPSCGGGKMTPFSTFRPGMGGSGARCGDGDNVYQPPRFLQRPHHGDPRGHMDHNPFYFELDPRTDKRMRGYNPNVQGSQGKPLV